MRAYLTQGPRRTWPLRWIRALLIMMAGLVVALWPFLLAGAVVVFVLHRI